MTNLLHKIMAVCLMLLPQISFGYDFEADGLYYEVTSLSNLECGLVRGENPYRENIIIPSTVDFNGKILNVTAILPNAFENADLSYIEIPNSVMSIANGIFDCNPKSVSILDGESSLYVGSSNQVIEDSFHDYVYRGALYGIEILYLGRNLDFPTGYTIVAGKTYGYNEPCEDSLIRTSNIGNTVTNLPTFNNSIFLESIEIGNGIEKIPDNTFSNCSNLSKIIMPLNCEEIGTAVFY